MFSQTKLIKTSFQMKIFSSSVFFMAAILGGCKTQIEPKFDLFNAICEKWNLQRVFFVLTNDEAVDYPGILIGLSHCNPLFVHFKDLNSSVIDSVKGVGKFVLIVEQNALDPYLSNLLDGNGMNNGMWFLPKLKSGDKFEKQLFNLRLDSQVYGKTKFSPLEFRKNQIDFCVCWTENTCLQNILNIRRIALI